MIVRREQKGGGSPRFSILLPVLRPPDLLPFAIESVQAQRQRDWELLVVCDGAPPETAACARRFSATDPRIQVFEFAKGERVGEAHRHTALQGARGALVAQIADDDQWFPDHLDALEKLLRRCDFGNLWQANVLPSGRMWVVFGDLGTEATRQRMLTSVWNFFGPTVAGYRMAAYRSLPVGWSPAPADLPGDFFMWRKFLAAPGLRCATRPAITALHFPASFRHGMSMEARRRESEGWAARIRSRRRRAALVARLRTRFWLQEHLPPSVVEAIRRVRRRVE